MCREHDRNGVRNQEKLARKDYQKMMRNREKIDNVPMSSSSSKTASP